MKEYVQIIHGAEHTVLLTPEEAERRGAVEVARPVDVVLPEAKAAVPANKARTATDK